MSEIYFERKTTHKIIIKKDGREIGHIFSKGSFSGENSIQVCGFDRTEGSWNCATFYNKKDICLIFDKNCEHSWETVGITFKYKKNVYKCIKCGEYKIEE